MSAEAMGPAMTMARKKLTVPTGRRDGGLRPECNPPSESLVLSQSR
jgi:hypothetical protein